MRFNMAHLSVEHISKSYGDFKALDDVSFSIPEGSIFGLLGPNGAGKTTLIRIINQIFEPDEGQILFKGKPIKKVASRSIGYLPEERGLYRKMKVGEQLIYLARLKGLSKTEAQQEIAKWMDIFNIRDWWEKKVESLSKGMAQKLQFIATVVHKPEFIILDEPFSGFDPVNAELVKNQILELRKQGTSIMLSTHRMESVEVLCDHISLIHKSKSVINGSVQEVKDKFKENIFEFIIEGMEEEAAIKTPENTQIVKHKIDRRKEQTLFRLQSPESLSPNELIKQLIKDYSLVGVQEILPSINDIFIHTVEEKVEENE